MKEHSVVHDSYLCKKLSFGGVQPKPFPTRRKAGEVMASWDFLLTVFPLGVYNFVGAAGPEELKSICPEECRPPGHKDWTLC